MTQFFLEQLDFVYFVYGLSFIFMAVVAATFQRAEFFKGVPWIWLTLFGVFYGLNEWMSMAAVTFGDSTAFKWVRYIETTFAYGFLFEFGRRGLVRQGFSLISGWWPTVLLLFPIAYSATIGQTQYIITVRYLFAFAGSLGAGVFLWSMVRTYTDKKVVFKFRLVSISFILFSFLHFFGPNIDYLLAPFVNQDLFLNIFHVPVQFIRALFALVITFGLYFIYDYLVEKKDEFAFDPEKKFHIPQRYLVLITVLSLLSAGWMITHITGASEKLRVFKEFREQAKLIKSILPEIAVSQLTGSEDDRKKKDVYDLHRQLYNLNLVLSDVKYIYYLIKKNNQFVFALDDEDETVPDYEPMGTPYDDAPSEFAQAYQEQKEMIIGPYSDRWGSFVTVVMPILDKQRIHTLALLGVDLPSDKLKHNVQHARFEMILFIFVISMIVLFFFFNWQIEKRRRILEQQVFQTGKLSTLGTLSVGVAHEMSNPLAVVAGNAELLSELAKTQFPENIPSEKVIKLTDKIQLAAKRMRDIVDHMRDFGRNVTMDRRVERSLNKVVQDSLIFLQKNVQEQNVNLTLDLFPSLPSMTMNSVKMESVVQNLIKNAIDAFDAVDDKRDKFIVVRTYLANNRLCLEVEDNASGIPSEIKDKIFDAFFTTKDVGKGTGLGLNLVKGIVKEHAGLIDIQTEWSKGTKFIISFPHQN